MTRSKGKKTVEKGGGAATGPTGEMGRIISQVNDSMKIQHAVHEIKIKLSTLNKYWPTSMFWGTNDKLKFIKLFGIFRQINISGWRDNRPGYVSRFLP